MPKVEIDGRSIEVADGTTVIQAADLLGVEIPHYCWHPGLTIAGNCRMCLVEIEKSPKLQIACNTRVTDGMVVHTTSPKTHQAQRAVLEFLLINHPIDCPVCDQAGECKLQEYYMDYDRQRSRFPLPEKVHKNKAMPIGPHVMLDQERCILCARCTRFLDEVTGTNELAIHERGDHCEIALAPGATLDNPYSANVVDICPVGALTNREFRFQARVWYLDKTESVCGACANGCNIDVYEREGRLFRFLPRANPDVNAYWMCDAGRFSWRGLQGEARLMEPLVRGANAFEVAEWDDALDAVAREVERDGGRSAVLVSAQATNEEIWLAARMAEAGGARVAGHAWSPAGAAGDDFLIKADKNPNGQGLAALGVGTADGANVLKAVRSGEVTTLVLVRADVARWWDDPATHEALERVRFLAVLDTDGSATAHYANVVLPVATYLETDGTFTNHAGRVQRLREAVTPPGTSRPGWRVLAALARRLGGAVPDASAAAVFEGVAASVEAYAGLTYEAVGTAGVAIGAAAEPHRDRGAEQR
jgi:NADH-quinone oxidoreductase subunit G